MCPIPMMCEIAIKAQLPKSGILKITEITLAPAIPLADQTLSPENHQLLEAYEVATKDLKNYLKLQLNETNPNVETLKNVQNVAEKVLEAFETAIITVGNDVIYNIPDVLTIYLENTFVDLNSEEIKENITIISHHLALHEYHHSLNAQLALKEVLDIIENLPNSPDLTNTLTTLVDTIKKRLITNNFLLDLEHYSEASSSPLPKNQKLFSYAEVPESNDQLINKIHVLRAKLV